MRTCGHCGKEVPQFEGKRKKEYCNNVCKQLAYKRRKNALKVNTPLVDGSNQVQKHYRDMLSELIELRAKVHDQNQDQDLAKKDDQITSQMQTIVELRQQIKGLEEEITRLKHVLDVEAWYHQDNEARGFKAWLKKQRATPLIEKLLADQFLPAGRKSRALYERYLISKNYTPEEQAEFAHLWKAMLLQS